MVYDITYHSSEAGKQRFDGSKKADFKIVYKSAEYKFLKEDLIKYSLFMREYCQKHPTTSQFVLVTEIESDTIIDKTLKLLAGYSNVHFSSKEMLDAFPLIRDLGIDKLTLQNFNPR